MSQTTPETRPFFQMPSPAAQKLELLRQHFPEAVQVDADGRVRVNAAAMQQSLDPANPAGIRVAEDGYELRWAGKREAYHTAFVPAERILEPLRDDSVDWDATGNVLIKGDNLDALRLLRQSYFGEVKLIYIDPPYNTQSDGFVYRDDFSQRQGEILAQLGYSAENAEYIKNIYGARTHSGWLSFMYPRLLLARDLLREDGVIFISIDDNEQAQLKLLCDEVFGQENFVGQWNWYKSATPPNLSKKIKKNVEYVLAYERARSNNKYKGIRKFSASDDPITKPQNTIKELKFPAGKIEIGLPDQVFAPGVYGTDKYEYELLDTLHVVGGTNRDDVRFKSKFTWTQPKLDMELTLETKMRISSDRLVISYKKKDYGEEVPPNLIDWSVGVGTTESAGTKLTALMGGVDVFDYPKPVELIAYLMGFCISDDDLILDFFAGSGTTAEAVLRLNAEDGGNRRFILVQLPEAIDAKKQKEAHGFVTDTLGKPEATIFEITAERIRRAGARLKAEHPELDTGFRVYALAEDPDALILQQPLAGATQADLLGLQQRITTPQPGQLPRVLANLLLAEGLPLSTRIETLVDERAYRAGDVLLVLQALETPVLRALLEQARADGAPIQAISVYAPWVTDDNFLLGSKTLLDTLNLSEDKLRLRG
ncbi:hypothetical protein MASR1M8_07000 [Thermomonas brevis]